MCQYTINGAVGWNRTNFLFITNELFTHMNFGGIKNGGSGRTRTDDLLLMKELR